MDLKEAEKIVGDYGGFLEYAYQPIHAVFLGMIPESLLPYSVEKIMDAGNIVAKSYHDKGDYKTVELIQGSLGFLLGYKDDEEAILQAVKNLNNQKMYDVITELIKNFRTSPNQKNYISGFFTDPPIEKVDFENQDLSTAHKIVDIYSKFLKYAHMRLFFVFSQKIPESFLPFPQEHIIKALDAQANIHDVMGNGESAETLNYGKSVLEDYTDDEVAIAELVKNFSQKETRDSIISDIKNFHK